MVWFTYKNRAPIEYTQENKENWPLTIEYEQDNKFWSKSVADLNSINDLQGYLELAGYVAIESKEKDTNTTRYEWNGKDRWVAFSVAGEQGAQTPNASFTAPDAYQSSAVLPGTSLTIIP